MLLTSIELNNFMCYSGMDNRFDFTEGINVIIGDNGYGKSKLYDGFYWVMYDKCFDTSIKTFSYTSKLKKAIISDKAIFDIEEGKITASVILTFHNPEKRDVVILERRYSIKKDGDKIIEDEKSEEIVSKKDLEFMNARIEKDPYEIERIKRYILPDNVKPYMWFQGEQVESIIDFNKSETLTDAINVLSNISKFDNIIKIADELEASSEKEYDKKRRDLSKDTNKSEQLSIDKEKLEKKIKELEKEEMQLRDSSSTAEEKADSKLNKLEEAQTIRRLDQRRKDLEKRLGEVQAEFDKEQINLHKKLFTNRWVLKGTEALFGEYNQKYEKYISSKLQKKALANAKFEATNELRKKLQTRLPLDVPEPIHINRMLEEEKCLVCDREAPKGSEAWLKIKELLYTTEDDNSKIEEEVKTNFDFESEFKKLYQNGLGLGHIIKNIDNDIQNTFLRKEEIESKRRTILEEFEKIEKELRSLTAQSAMTSTEAFDILNGYTVLNEQVKRFATQIANQTHLINNKKKELDQINKDLSSLVVGEIPKYLEEKRTVLNEFYQVAHSTRKRVFQKLVKMLEEEANKHYQNMIQRNLSARGIIKLKELTNGKNYMPELVDENGNVLHQLNTGNIILIKLATIMAIISARKASRDTDLYTLITDAPMSVFGDDYTLGFCKTVSQVYKQSIIMSKEFYRNETLRRELLENEEIRLGKVYMITPTIPETDRTNRKSLATNIKALN
ncbi:AAA family ATPase [Cognataquiflexum aquatile]|uniref:AAA family ATPase n=1 Tax=Cognataquiflexum aquatile TaxID=2249427 RepID=UPI000DEA9487|nr:AAA family ATPase [Cognataquiflexum aquatile]